MSSIILYSPWILDTSFSSRPSFSMSNVQERLIGFTNCLSELASQMERANFALKFPMSVIRYAASTWRCGFIFFKYVKTLPEMILSLSISAASAQIPSNRFFFLIMFATSKSKAFASRSGVTPRSMALTIILCSWTLERRLTCLL